MNECYEVTIDLNPTWDIGWLGMNNDLSPLSPDNGGRSPQKFFVEMGPTCRLHNWTKMGQNLLKTLMIFMFTNSECYTPYPNRIYLL